MIIPPRKAVVFEMCPERWISQERLRRYQQTHDALIEEAECLDRMIKAWERRRQVFLAFKADLEKAIKMGLPVEDGPIWDQIRRRKMLRTGNGHRRAG